MTKRAILLAVCMLSLCMLISLTAVTPARAQASGGTHTNCEVTSNPVPTIDGQWTTSTEWVEGSRQTLGTGQNAAFYDLWNMVMGSSTYSVYYNLIAETLDNTNDPGDYWQICFNTQNDPASTPQSDDFLVNITGHTTCTWYQGTGSGWTAISAPPSSTFSWVEGLHTSPVYTNQHYILEIAVTKTDSFGGQTSILGQYFNIRVAVYDAHAGGNGLQVWPASSSRDSPSSWGYISYSSSANSSPDPLPIPESLSVAVIMVLSVVSVAAGSVILGKRSKLADLASKRN